MRNLEMPRHGWEGISNGGEIYGNSNKNMSDSDILLDEVYKEWLKFGGLEHNSKNYKQYLEDMKEVAKKTANPLSKEEIEEKKLKEQKKIEEVNKRVDDLLAELDAMINNAEYNSTEKKHSSRR